MQNTDVVVFGIYYLGRQVRYCSELANRFVGKLEMRYNFTSNSNATSSLLMLISMITLFSWIIHCGPVVLMSTSAASSLRTVVNVVYMVENSFCCHKFAIFVVVAILSREKNLFQ